MDTSSTEEMTQGQATLGTHIQEVWETSHIIDPAAAAEAIMERLRKGGDELWQNVCDHLGILGEIEPESTPGGGVQFTSEIILDAIIKAIVAEEYARSLSAQDRLIFGAGLKPETAQAIVALMECAALADEAADDLTEALTHEDFSALCRQTEQATGLTTADDAALAMLAEIPGLDAMLPSAGLLPPLFGYDVRKHILAALAEHYRERLEESESM